MRIEVTAERLWVARAWGMVLFWCPRERRPYWTHYSEDPPLAEPEDFEDAARCILDYCSPRTVLALNVKLPRKEDA